MAAGMGSHEKIHSIQELMEEMLVLQQENTRDTETMQRAQDIILTSSGLVKDSSSPNEIVLDAKILHAGSQVVNTNVTSFDPNLTVFDELKYKKGILKYVGECNSAEPDLSWKCMANLTYPIYKRSNAPIFVLGSVDFTPPPVKEKTRAERVKKVAENLTTLTATTIKDEKDKSEHIDENICDHILKALISCYGENNNEPVNFLEFIVDPNSYWSTVQNIFYFSFLVRDGRATLFLHEHGFPVAEPHLENGSKRDEEEKVRSQFSLGINKTQWRKCVEKFNITTAKIQPLEKN